MTRETKVGLIVGLAFIVVFAVILSHKGTQPRAADSGGLGPFADGGSAVFDSAPPALDTLIAPDRDAAPAVEPAKPEATAVPAPTADSVPTPASPTAEPRVPLPKMPIIGTASPEGDRPDVTALLDTWLDGIKSASGSTETAEAPKRTAPPVVTPVAEAEPQKAEVKPADAKPATPVPSMEPAVKPAIKEEYVTQKGDTLTRIANRVYGESSLRAIKAIIAANPKELPDANTVKAGSTLLIPELPKDKFETASFPPPGRLAKAASEGAAPVKAIEKETAEKAAATATVPRVYVVQANDTFGTIALKQLGTSTRWKEIHELNRKDFPDPTKLRVGATIRLPANGGGSSEL